MLSNTRQFVTSVTFDDDENMFDFLGLGRALYREPTLAECRKDIQQIRLHLSCNLETRGQKQHEFSASCSKVKELLGAAKNNGMTQKEFELLTAKLRPGRSDSSERASGWNGVLWNHYYVRGARMGLVSFLELVCQLAEKKWISAVQKEVFDAYAREKHKSVVFSKERKNLMLRGKVSPRHSLYANEDGA